MILKVTRLETIILKLLLMFSFPYSMNLKKTHILESFNLLKKIRKLLKLEDIQHLSKTVISIKMTVIFFIWSIEYLQCMKQFIFHQYFKMTMRRTDRIVNTSGKMCSSISSIFIFWAHGPHESTLPFTH